MNKQKEKAMKKILIPLFLILITNNVYSEGESSWTKQINKQKANVKSVDGHDAEGILTSNEKTGMGTGIAAGTVAGGALAGTLTKKKETEKAESEMADYINSWTCYLGGLPLTLNDTREFSLPNVSNKFIELQLEYSELETKLANM